MGSCNFALNYFSLPFQRGNWLISCGGEKNFPSKNWLKSPFRNIPVVTLVRKYWRQLGTFNYPPGRPGIAFPTAKIKHRKGRTWSPPFHSLGLISPVGWEVLRVLLALPFCLTLLYLNLLPPASARISFNSFVFLVHQGGISHGVTRHACPCTKASKLPFCIWPTCFFLPNFQHVTQEVKPYAIVFLAQIFGTSQLPRLEILKGCGVSEAGWTRCSCLLSMFSSRQSLKLVHDYSNLLSGLPAANLFLKIWFSFFATKEFEIFCTCHTKICGSIASNWLFKREAIFFVLKQPPQHILDILHVVSFPCNAVPASTALGQGLPDKRSVPEQ